MKSSLALYLTVFLMSLSLLSSAQILSPGISFQAYPAGLISAITLEKSTDQVNYLHLRLGGNFADRKDFSPYNDLEKGNGFGASIGYRKKWHREKGTISFGPSLDFWNMWIHWEDNVGEANYSTGTSYTFVIQPWIDLGYEFSSSGPWKFSISMGFGREINAVTKGEAVGEGWMNSLLVNIHYCRPTKVNERR